MGRRALLLTPLLLVSLGVGSAHSATNVIGGSAQQIQGAPWTVFVRQVAGNTSFLCSGSVLDSLHILTAAHCVFDSLGNVTTPGALSIRAGISNYAAPLATDVEQDRTVSSFRVHPDYIWSESAVPDDVAVLALNAPLDLSGPAVQAVALPAPGGVFPAGAVLGLAGFGREATTANPDGSLNWFTPTAQDQGTCAGRRTTVVLNDNAIAFCAGSTTSSACNGDSGAALVTSTTPRIVYGIASAAPATCDVGSQAVYTYVGAPEILRFIQGDQMPPVAPRQVDQTFVRLAWDAELIPGTTVTCSAGAWNGFPTSTAYTFLDTRTNAVLQQGPKPTYAVATKDVGAELSCRAAATNDGGTNLIQTSSTQPVGRVPKLGIAPPRGVVLVPGRSIDVRVVLKTPAGLEGKFGVCVTPPAGVGSRTCRSTQVTDRGSGGFPLDVHLHVKPTAKAGTARLAITAVAGVAHATATAVAVVRAVQR